MKGQIILPNNLFIIDIGNFDMFRKFKKNEKKRKLQRRRQQLRVRKYRERFKLFKFDFKFKLKRNKHRSAKETLADSK